MTTKSAKTTKSADGTASGTGADSAGTGGATAKPAKAPTTSPKARQRPAVGDSEARAERKARTDTKQSKLIAMLAAKDGATVDEVATALGWQAHTVRGAIYGALRKKLGLDIVSEKVEGRGRVYRIGS